MVHGFSVGEFSKTIGKFAIVQGVRGGRTFLLKPQPRASRSEVSATEKGR